VKLTLNLGQFTRAAAPSEYNYTVTLSGPDHEETHKVAKGVVSITLQVTAGAWNIRVEAYLEEELVYVGSAQVDVTPGKENRVSVSMKEPGSYTIAYHNIEEKNLRNQDTGVSNQNPASHSGKTALTLEEPVRTDGASFAGWYRTANFLESGKVTEIPAGNIEDQEFWAKWTFPVKFHGIGGATKTTVPVTEGVAVSAGAYPVVELPGWDEANKQPIATPCDAWYTTEFNDGSIAGAGTKWDLSGRITGALDLYARWEAWDTEDFGSVNPVINGVYTIENAADWTTLQSVELGGIFTGGALSDAARESLNTGNYIVYVERNITGVQLDGLLKGGKMSIRGNGSLAVGQSNAPSTSNPNAILIVVGGQPDGPQQIVTLRGPDLIGDAYNNSSLVLALGGVFNLRSGAIKNNRSTYTPDVSVSIPDGSSGAASGGSFASSGGVYILLGGAFNMWGGSITGNTAFGADTSFGQGKGGGALVSNGTFTMYGGIISDNSASFTGGGIYVSSGGILNIVSPASTASIFDNHCASGYADHSFLSNVDFAASGSVFQIDGVARSPSPW
jgi:hypothetical protein